MIAARRADMHRHRGEIVERGDGRRRRTGHDKLAHAADHRIGEVHAFGPARRHREVGGKHVDPPRDEGVDHRVPGQRQKRHRQRLRPGAERRPQVRLELAAELDGDPALLGAVIDEGDRLVGHPHPHEAPRHHAVEVADPGCHHRRDQRVLGALGVGQLDGAAVLEHMLRRRAGPGRESQCHGKQRPEPPCHILTQVGRFTGKRIPSSALVSERYHERPPPGLTGSPGGLLGDRGAGATRRSCSCGGRPGRGRSGGCSRSRGPSACG